MSSKHKYYKDPAEGESISLKKTLKMEYDEDLSENPFFRTFIQLHVDLFSKCVQESLLIAIPRKESLPKYAFTIEDFNHHILEPISRQRNDSGGSLLNSSTSSSTSSSPSTNDLDQWNYRTLSHVRVKYAEGSLTIDLDHNGNTLNYFQDSSTTSPSSQPPSKYRSIPILFEETFYTHEKSKYKVLCVSSPLNSKVNEDSNGDSTPGEIWNISSLRDCIDFLWLKGSLSLLESVDGHIKIFLHSHRSFETLPVQLQKDLVYSLYHKCLELALNSFSGSNSTSGDYSHIKQSFKLSIETYIINGIYKSLMNGVTASTAQEDAHLNKIIRNLAEILPQDLNITSIHLDKLRRSKTELSKINSYTSPLGKLFCLRRALRFLNSDAYPESTGQILTTDDYLPIWAYLIIKSGVGNWYAQLQFLSTYRFSAIGKANDNENDFYISTLEAAITHLNSGRVSGMNEEERDVGVGFELGERWLHNLHESVVETEDPSSPLPQMFNCIRQGASEKLKEVIETYEAMRSQKLTQMQQNFSAKNKEMNSEEFCHPLCSCEKCTKLLAPKAPEPCLPRAVELASEEGQTLLHIACIYGRPKILDYLINEGCPLEMEDSSGSRGVHFAAMRGHQNCLLLLLHSGAKIEVRDSLERTPLHLAVANGHLNNVKALIYYSEHSQAPINISAQDFNLDTPLHFASRWGFREICQILVEHGAAIKIPNKRSTTPLDCAHDLHITRILQQSIRRRSYVQSPHGDFINIDLVRNENSPNVLMIVNDPVAEYPPLERGTSAERALEEAANEELETQSNSSRNYCNSCNSSIGRRNSSISGLESSHSEALLNDLERSTQRINLPLNGHSSRVDHLRRSEPESSRKVSTESLNVQPPHILAQAAVMGVKRRRDNEGKKIRKLFNAIAIGDIPLSCFYLGIPPEELETEEIRDGDGVGLSQVPICDPLCQCTRCWARDQGLGFDINVMNSEGMTPLHLAVQYELASLIKILFKFRADLNLRSKYEGTSPLDIAKERRSKEIEQLLRNLGAND